MNCLLDVAMYLLVLLLKNVLVFCAFNNLLCLILKSDVFKELQQFLLQGFYIVVWLTIMWLKLTATVPRPHKSPAVSDERQWRPVDRWATHSHTLQLARSLSGNHRHAWESYSPVNLPFHNLGILFSFKSVPCHKAIRTHLKPHSLTQIHTNILTS